MNTRNIIIASIGMMICMNSFAMQEEVSSINGELKDIAVKLAEAGAELAAKNKVTTSIIENGAKANVLLLESNNALQKSNQLLQESNKALRDSFDRIVSSSIVGSIVIATICATACGYMAYEHEIHAYVSAKASTIAAYFERKKQEA